MFKFQNTKKDYSAALVILSDHYQIIFSGSPSCIKLIFLNAHVVYQILYQNMVTVAGPLYRLFKEERKLPIHYYYTVLKIHRPIHLSPWQYL